MSQKRKNSSKMAFKKTKKAKVDKKAEEELEVETPLTRIEEDSPDEDSASSDDSNDSGDDVASKSKKKDISKWTNKQRLLIFGSRGIGHRDRHLLEDIKTLLPHAKGDSKMQRKESLFVINEIAEMKNCNKCLFFEGRKNRKDLYLWASNISRGPSVKFQVENVHTLGELKMTGNCLKSSRPLLSFDNNFEKEAYLQVLKELFVQIFGVPNHHPKSQPFFDHVFTFSVVDNRIWFRNFQIVEENGSLVEIGPRFVLNPIKIFESSFSGRTLWENPKYVTPSAHRSMLKQMKAGKYRQNVQKKAAYIANKPTESTYDLEDMDLFQ